MSFTGQSAFSADGLGETMNEKGSKNESLCSVVADDLKKVKHEEPCKLRQKDVESVLSKLFEVVV